MKKKVLRNLGIVSLALTCVALSPKTVNAAKITNDSFEKAEEIKAGQKMDVTCEDDNEKYKDRYYKFKISNENTWTDFQMTNYAGEMAMQIYDSDRTLISKTGRIWTGNIVKMHVASENSGHVEGRDAILLAPEETYYFVIQPNYWADGRVQNYHFEVNSTKDDNWGMRENAKELAINKKVKGNLEFKDDIDSFCVKLPKDNQKHNFYISANKGAEVFFRNSNDSELGEVTIEKNRINSEFSCKGKGQKVYIYMQGLGEDSYKNAQYTIKVTSPISKKTISTLIVSKCKKDMKVVKGKTISKANVKVTVNGKAYKTVKSNARGNFAVKTKKLKAGQKIKVTVSKSGYKARTSGTIIVKKK